MTREERKEHLQNEIADMDRKIESLQARLINIYQAREKASQQLVKFEMQDIQERIHDKDID